MTKTLIILSLLTLFFGSAFEVLDHEIFEQRDSNQPSAMMDSQPNDVARALRQGMGLMEVERTLHGEGIEQRMVRSIRPQTSDPLDWNVGWEIARTYETEPQGSRSSSITAVFEAWTDDSFDGRPPASAFRLVRWD